MSGDEVSARLRPDTRAELSTSLRGAQSLPHDHIMEANLLTLVWRCVDCGWLMVDEGMPRPLDFPAITE